MKVLRVSEARAGLPSLIRKVASGHPPIAIGRRGKAEAWLVAVPPEGKESVAAPLVGTLQLVGTAEDLRRAHEQIRILLEESLARTAETLTHPTAARRGRRPVRRKGGTRSLGTRRSP